MNKIMIVIQNLANVDDGEPRSMMVTTAWPAEVPSAGFELCHLGVWLPGADQVYTLNFGRGAEQIPGTRTGP